MDAGKSCYKIQHLLILVEQTRNREEFFKPIMGIILTEQQGTSTHLHYFIQHSSGGSGKHSKARKEKKIRIGT